MKKEPEEIAFIRLVGEPYQHADGTDASNSLDILAHNTRYRERLRISMESRMAVLEPLTMQGGYYAIDGKIKHGKDLTFSEAFSLITFVTSALNKPLLDEVVAITGQDIPIETRYSQAVALLSAMSAKESYAQLTAPEIAGMVAATIELDTVSRPDPRGSLFAVGGMGGDRGYLIGNEAYKPQSLSTIATLGLAAFAGAHKHHSYPNTSKVAGQSAIEAFGARSDFHSEEAMLAVFHQSDILMTSCHNTRTLHTLSHRLRGETINHVIGPLAFTLSAETELHGLIGVNEKIHPELIIEAMEILAQNGCQKYHNSVSFCGTSLERPRSILLDPLKYYKSRHARESIRLDELAPPPFISLASFLVDGVNQGTYFLYPEDFYSQEVLAGIKFGELVVENSVEAITRANARVLTGLDRAKMLYLAMTIGLGVFVKKHATSPDALDRRSHRVNRRLMRQATQEAYEVLSSGLALKNLESYVAATQKHAGEPLRR